MKCFYHNDLDGKCAGAIVHSFYKSNSIVKDSSFIPIDYKDDFPFDSIKEDEPVVIVDFSLQKPEDFGRLLKITNNVIWIDHHQTAIEKYKDINVAGIRRNGVAGCVLTWKYFYPDIKVPLVVEMLGAYDVWDFSKFGEDLNVLQAGVNLNDNSPEDAIWQHYLRGDIETYSETMKQGKIALLFRNKRYESLIKSWSFYANFEGYRAVCCNVGSTSSNLFDSVKGDYDLMMPFVFDGKQWTVSIYTKKDIDCSELARKHGGGGHKQAAGFQCKTLPFEVING